MQGATYTPMAVACKWLVRLPKEYIDMDLEIQIKPVKKPATKFSDFLMDSCTIDKYMKFDRNTLSQSPHG